MSNELEEQEKDFISSEVKGQVTIYIDADLLDTVEEVFYLSRKRLPRTKRGKLSKSKFYELIIGSIISDKKLIAKIISDFEKSQVT